MAQPPEQFARRTPGIRHAREPPAAWETVVHSNEELAVYAATLSSGADCQVMTVATGLSGRRQCELARRMASWEAHDHHEGIVTVIARGETPRPWVAVEPPADRADRLTGQSSLRSVLVDLAEAFWWLQRHDKAALPSRRHLRIEGTPARAQLRWPLAVEQSPQPNAVQRLGQLGKELSASDRADGVRRGQTEGTDELLALLERAASDSPAGPDSCYALKRAILFGSAAVDTGRSDRSQSAYSWVAETTAGSDRSGPGASQEQADPTESAEDDPTAQVSRRTVVGLLSVGALGITGLVGTRGTDSDRMSIARESVPSANFAFSESDGTLRVLHDAGDSLRADQLVLENTRFSGTGRFPWTDFEGFDERSTVTPGDSIAIDTGVQSMWWIQVVWESPDRNTGVVLAERDISEEELY